VTDTVARRVVFIAAASGTIMGSVPVSGMPTGLAWPIGAREVLVADRLKRTITVIDPDGWKPVRSIPAGRRPQGIAATPDGRTLVVCDSADDQALIIDGASGDVMARIPAGRQSESVSITADGRTAVVAALLPAGKASADAAAQVTVIDLERRQGVPIALPPGSTCCRGVSIRPDGGLAAISHLIGRTNMPTTHLDAGWVVTNAVSFIDLRTRQRLATVLLDRLGDGAANPWGIAFGEQGKVLWVALSGVHELAVIDMERLERLLAGQVAEADLTGLPAIWRRIRSDGRARDDLVTDLTALAGAGLIRRHAMSARGPRGIAVEPHGRTIAVAMYFGAALIQGGKDGPWRTTGLGVDAEADPVRQGERMYHDATLSYQRWTSCSSCHPQGRADGLNWDLLNDGVGNPKNTRSHVWVNKRAPCMSLGVRTNHRMAIQAGFRHILFHEPLDAEIAGIDRYVSSLQPEPSPWRNDDGSLSMLAEQGRALFEGKGGCTTCHAGPWRSDQKPHLVGTTQGGFDRGKPIMTPMLVEPWRTAPYFHDGSAATIMEVLRANHGRAGNLNAEEQERLAEYLKSL
jgi:DNA-binding beta-propeller fold protein YncE/mono/diheme cytochrome c family protein